MSDKKYRQKVIGIDARFYLEAGPGRYCKNIIENLEKIDHENRYKVFLRPKGLESYIPQNPNFEKILANYPWYSWKEQIGFLIFLYKQKLDLYYVPHFNVPVLYFKKIVTAIPDLIMHEFSTDGGTTLPKAYFAFKKIVYKFVFGSVIKRTEKNICPSMDVVNDFRKYYPNIPDSKYVLAYEGVDAIFVDKRLDADAVVRDMDIKGSFLLYVSSMYEHKNVGRLLEAFKILKDSYKYPGQLVIIGKKDKFAERVRLTVYEQHLSNDVLLPGMTRYISDAEITSLRTKADLYVFPSLKEGFSLTPLESQAVGLACAISDIPCHKEIYGDSVQYFDPLSTEDMAMKIDEVLKSDILKQDLIRKGAVQVTKYNWLDTAKITLEVFNNLLKN